MPVPLFDRSLLKLKPLSERVHDLDISVIKDLDSAMGGSIDESIKAVAQRIMRAKSKSASVIFMAGAHVIRSGVQKYLIDLIEKGYISCIALNGAGMIHDFELAFCGATTESVARYIKEGQFGLWQETGRINDIINKAYKPTSTAGMGEVVGRFMNESSFPYKSISILSAAYRGKVPVTVHISIGCDIIHEHPNFDAASAGALSYNDFLKFVSVVSNLEGGVVMNFGSAIMAPEVFLKALSMARNVAHQKGEEIKRFTTLVCDLISLPDSFRQGPSKDDPAYYFRPWKTMLARAVADGGESFYIKGRHEETIPSLWRCIQNADTLK